MSIIDLENVDYQLPEEGLYPAKIVRVDYEATSNSVVVEVSLNDGQFSRRIFADPLMNKGKIILKRLFETFNYQGEKKFADLFELTSALSSICLGKHVMVEVKHYTKKDGTKTWIVNDVKPLTKQVNTEDLLPKQEIIEDEEAPF